jgi:hypothetical protein
MLYEFDHQNISEFRTASGTVVEPSAKKTGIPLGTVKTRLELGVKKLRAAVCAMGSREEWLLVV